MAPLKKEALRIYVSSDTVCITRALLRVQSAAQTIAPWEAPPLSKNARYSFLGMQVPSWPDGELRRGPRWEELIGEDE